jgi:hypothetical protein
MKTPALLVLLALSTSPALAGNWFGSGPWANATYYPGNLDGKYQAAVTGINTSGVLGFAIRDGSPPFLEIETQSTGDALVTDAVIRNQTIEIDRSLNYYLVFVNGRTYAGVTAAGINYNNNKVFGTLQGSQPSTIDTTNSVVTPQTVAITNITNETSIITIDGTPTTIITAITNVTTNTVFTTNQFVNPIVIATGVDGAFQANVTGKRGIFTFKGPGQLTSPGVVVDGTQINPVTPFNVNGIRVSFSSQANFQNLNTTPGGGQ